jgi:chromosomal replication initiator protein
LRRPPPFGEADRRIFRADRRGKKATDMASSARGSSGQPIDPALWQEALARLRDRTRSVTVPAWLADARLGSVAGSRVEVRLPESASDQKVAAVLKRALQRALEAAIGRRIHLEFRQPDSAAAPPTDAAPAEPAPADPRRREACAKPPKAAQEAPTAPLRDSPALNPLYTFENFVTGPCNRLAHAASLAVADLPGRAYNPLFVHASVGLGKSHLLQAICHRILADHPDPDASGLAYISCEDFVNRFITAIGRGQTEQFRQRFRHLGVLVIDDIHFLADKDRTQEEFFHTFNTLYQAQKQVVLSSDSPPHEIPSLEERLVSRFKWGLVVRVDRPSFETRVAIVQKKARLRERDLPEDVVQYIASVVDTNNRELEGAVVRVLGYASLCNRQVDLALAKEALRDLIATPTRAITIQEVADAVIRRYSARLSDLQGRERAQSVAVPRQICMFLARRLSNRSLEEIGVFFGGRDHTTVLHAERKVRRTMEHDPAFRGLVEAIERDILRSQSGG